MTATKAFGLGCGVALAAMMMAGAAQAHDPSGKGGMPMVYQKRVMEAMKALSKMDDSDQAKGMYSRLVQWPPSYAKLRVCFMDGSFIGVQPHKFLAVLYIDLVWVLALQIIQGTLQTILESIGHGDEFYISFLGGKVLIRGTTSTTTAADQCELELITPGDLGAEFDGKTGGGNRGGGGGARLEESPASWIDGG